MPGSVRAVIFGTMRPTMCFRRYRFGVQSQIARLMEA
jgi:hypothetical protein